MSDDKRSESAEQRPGRNDRVIDPSGETLYRVNDRWFERDGLFVPDHKEGNR